MARFAVGRLGQTRLAKFEDHVGQTGAGLAKFTLVVGQTTGMAKITRWMGKTRMERHAVHGLGQTV